MKRITLFGIGLALGLLITTLPAQVPQLINYQGRVVVGTTNFDGSGQFKFALVNATGTTTFWSNDNTSTAGSEPTTAVALPVSKGLYSVLLGDATIPNMGVMPASVFNNSDVRLRVWFNDGTNGVQLLTPDQRIAAVGYALMATNVVDGAITGAKIATGAVGSAQLGSNLTLGGTTTGSFSGNVNGSATGFSGSLAGNVTGSQGATVVATVGGVTAANVAAGANLANAATTANTANTIVRRDASGNFAAGIVTGNVTGNAAGFTGSLAGNVTGTQGATVVSTVGGVSAANVAAGVNLANAATDLNTANAIVMRNVSGDFTAGTITTIENLLLSTTNSTGTVGVINQNGSRLIHSRGSDNFFAGANAGNFTLTGSSNTAIGVAALSANTFGSSNTAIGRSALSSNLGGSNNVAIGLSAMTDNANGSSNTAVGGSALTSNTNGVSNTGVGSIALFSNLTGGQNTAIGANALFANTASFNTAVGHTALNLNTFGDSNTAVGQGSLRTNAGGFSNAALGRNALGANTSGHSNVALGADSLDANTTGMLNTAGGIGALGGNTTGSSNIALGVSAGINLTTGSFNIAIGNNGVAADANTMRIGTVGNQSRTFIAGIRGVTTGTANGITVLIDSAGQLGTVSSSRRYKEEIADMGDASARLRALRPVVFRYKQPYADGEKPMQYGLIAEEVAEAFPELAVLNEEGQPETVKYQDLTPLLLNEFLRERQRSSDAEDILREENAQMKKRLAELETSLARLESKEGTR